MSSKWGAWQIMSLQRSEMSGNNQKLMLLSLGNRKDYFRLVKTNEGQGLTSDHASRQKKNRFGKKNIFLLWFTMQFSCSPCPSRGTPHFPELQIAEVRHRSFIVLGFVRLNVPVNDSFCPYLMFIPTPPFPYFVHNSYVLVQHRLKLYNQTHAPYFRFFSNITINHRLSSRSRSIAIIEAS